MNQQGFDELMMGEYNRREAVKAFRNEINHFNKVRMNMHYDFTTPGSAGKGIPSTSVRDSRLFEQALDRVNEAFSCLSNVINGLCDRFSPVLREYAEKDMGETKMEGRGSSSEFDAFVNDIEQRLNSFTVVVQSVIDRSAV